MTALLALEDGEFTLVFVKRSFFDKEQRREKPIVSGDSKVALKSAFNLAAKHGKQAVASVVVNLVILPKIV